MYKHYTKFVKILEICKQFSENLVKESGNVPRRSPIPKFSDLEEVALSLTAETESIDSEKWLFNYKMQEYKDSIPNLISRGRLNDRRKKTAGLCEELRKRNTLQDWAYWQFLASSRLRFLCFAEYVLFWFIAVRQNFFLTSSLKKSVFYNWLINNILYLCVPSFWGTQKIF